MKQTIVVAAVLLAACATVTHYERLQWARMSVEQAAAQCRAEVQASLLMAFDTCMEKYGWRAVD